MEAIKEFITDKDNFGIICHKSPDGDTLGSGLALYHGLRQLGKSCNIYCVDVPDSMYRLLDGIKDIKPLADVKESNLIFCDCADEDRAAFDGDLSKYQVLNIDHHISNTDFGNVNLVDAKACATCQVMYYVLEYIGVKLNSTIAKSLYVGICTDTNNFTNSNVTSETFEVVSKLTKYEFAISDIVKILFRTKSFAKTKATALYIDRIRLMFEGKFAVSYILLEDIERLGLEDTEGFVNIGVDIEGVSVSAFVKEKEDGEFKVSLRSNYDVDVCKICNTFGGGGHIKASGCCIKGNVEEVINALSNEVSKWME